MAPRAPPAEAESRGEKSRAAPPAQGKAGSARSSERNRHARACAQARTCVSAGARALLSRQGPCVLALCRPSARGPARWPRTLRPAGRIGTACFHCASRPAGPQGAAPQNLGPPSITDFHFPEQGPGDLPDRGQRPRPHPSALHPHRQRSPSCASPRTGTCPPACTGTSSQSLV